MSALRSIREFSRNDAGATAIEYCLALALISLAMLVSAEFLGDGLQDFYENLTAILAAVIS